jgi:hypothetical protein
MLALADTTAESETSVKFAYTVFADFSAGAYIAD